MTNILESTCQCGAKLSQNIETIPVLVAFECSECNEIRYGYSGSSNNLRKSSEFLWLAILKVFQQNKPPMTVRQVFYALSVLGAVDKSEKGYRQAQYALSKMRRSGCMPYGWIADSTRWQRKPTSYDTLSDAIDHWQRTYRRDLWAGKDERVEIWLEKDALAGVVVDVTSEYDVALMVARGYSSISFAHEAAEAMKARGKLTFIYHFGDWDPSGVDAADKIEKALAEEHGALIYFERVAVTPKQIETMNLPSRPTKRKDPRAKTWTGGESVELDAIPANTLRQLVRDAIERHVTPDELSALRRIEAVERDSLMEVFESAEGHFLY